VTVLFSTHILSDVERICDRIAVIDNGKIQLEDSIVNIRRNYGVQALEIDLASGDISELRALLDKVEWVKNTSVADNGTLKVYVTDMEKAQVNLPGIIAEKRMALKKFSVAEGTLEEAFMKAVSADE
jgi:ABC-2 type transport system ATP-binding protein